jgi:hypothetical protein
MPPPLQAHIRYLIDRLQVLLLTKPHMAEWLLGWVTVFLNRHTKPLT